MYYGDQRQTVLKVIIQFPREAFFMKASFNRNQYDFKQNLHNKITNNKI